MNRFIRAGILVICLAYVAGCSIGGSDEEEPVPVSFSATVSPDNAGSVSPGSRSFNSGDSVTVEAKAFTGYAFSNWSGDRESTSNPYTFVITGDTRLTANFEPNSSNYEVFMSVADTTDTLETLRFGQKINAGDEIGDEDLEAPPPPPGDQLHAYFKNDVDLFWDYRSITNPNITWDLQLQPGQTDSLFFSWSIDETLLNGSITLRTETSSLEINMVDSTSFAIHKNDADHLLIEYVLGGN